ncbi:hypothetical protein Tco_0852502 [Tanacetum coccineum]
MVRGLLLVVSCSKMFPGFILGWNPDIVKVVVSRLTFSRYRISDLYSGMCYGVPMIADHKPYCPFKFYNSLAQNPRCLRRICVLMAGWSTRPGDPEWDILLPFSWKLGIVAGTDVTITKAYQWIASRYFKENVGFVKVILMSPVCVYPCYGVLTSYASLDGLVLLIILPDLRGFHLNAEGNGFIGVNRGTLELAVSYGFSSWVWDNLKPLLCIPNVPLALDDIVAFLIPVAKMKSIQSVV